MLPPPRTPGPRDGAFPGRRRGGARPPGTNRARGPRDHLPVQRRNLRLGAGPPCARTGPSGGRALRAPRSSSRLATGRVPVRGFPEPAPPERAGRPGPSEPVHAPRVAEGIAPRGLPPDQPRDELLAPGLGARLPPWPGRRSPRGGPVEDRAGRSIRRQRLRARVEVRGGPLPPQSLNRVRAIRRGVRHTSDSEGSPRDGTQPGDRSTRVFEVSECT